MHLMFASRAASLLSLIALTSVSLYNCFLQSNAVVVIPPGDGIQFDEISNTITSKSTDQDKTNLIARDYSRIKRRADATNDDDGNNITIAACHKSVYGSVTLSSVVQWATYHHLLGVDKVYIWYLTSMMNVTDPVSGRNFVEALRELPFVELIENKQGKLRKYDNDVNHKNGYIRVDRSAPGGQEYDERQCLKMMKDLNYTWVLLSDADEYLWLNTSSDEMKSNISNNEERIDLKSVLKKYDSYNYLSFGKWIYSMMHVPYDNTTVSVHNRSTETLWDFEKFSYTAKSFCFFEKRPSDAGKEYCPVWRGRAKVIVRPQDYSSVKVHGHLNSLETRPYAMHFPTSVAHYKEWPAVYKDLAMNNTYETEPVVQVKKQDAIGDLHNAPFGYHHYSKDYLKLFRDDNLTDWFKYVMSFDETYGSSTI